MTTSPESDLISSQSSSKWCVILYPDLFLSYAEKSFLLAVEDLDTVYEIKERENGSGLIFLKNHWKSSLKFWMVALTVTGFAVLKSSWIVGRVLEKALILS